jgi:hypothetical protein
MTTTDGNNLRIVKVKLSIVQIHPVKILMAVVVVRVMVPLAASK